MVDVSGVCIAGVRVGGEVVGTVSSDEEVDVMTGDVVDIPCAGGSVRVRSSRLVRWERN